MTRRHASILIPHWMSKKIDAIRYEHRDQTSVIGDYPYLPSEVEIFLTQRGVPLQPLDEDTATVVLGQECQQPDLRKIKGMLIDSAHESPLLYSQEMFLALLVTGKDPLDEDDDELDRMVANYESFAFLMDPEFEWPFPLTLTDGAGGSIDAELLEIGFLRWLGYRVGQSGKRADERRPLLDQAFEEWEVLPDEFPEYYRRAWGASGSARRLKKIADSIAHFRFLHGRKLERPREAIADWESDLLWLYKKRYKDRFQFRWPRIDD